LAEPACGSPSTIKFRIARDRVPGIGQLSGQAAGIHRGFSPRQLARLACGFPGARRVNALSTMRRARRVLVEIFAQALVDELLDGPFDVA